MRVIVLPPVERPRKGRKRPRKGVNPIHSRQAEALTLDAYTDEPGLEVEFELQEGPKLPEACPYRQRWLELVAAGQVEEALADRAPEPHQE